MQNRDRHPTDALFPMLYGCGASLVTALFLITAFTLAACNSSNPTSLIDPLSCAALLISSLTGGFFAAHSRKGASSPLPGYNGSRQFDYAHRRDIDPRRCPDILNRRALNGEKYAVDPRCCDSGRGGRNNRPPEKFRTSSKKTHRKKKNIARRELKLHDLDIVSQDQM